MRQEKLTADTHYLLNGSCKHFDLYGPRTGTRVREHGYLTTPGGGSDGDQ